MCNMIPDYSIGSFYGDWLILEPQTYGGIFYALLYRSQILMKGVLQHKPSSLSEDPTSQETTFPEHVSNTCYSSLQTQSVCKTCGKNHHDKQVRLKSCLFLIRILEQNNQSDECLISYRNRFLLVVKAGKSNFMANESC